MIKIFLQVSSESRKGVILHLIMSRPDLLRDPSLVKFLRLLLTNTGILSVDNLVMVSACFEFGPQIVMCDMLLFSCKCGGIFKN